MPNETLYTWAQLETAAIMWECVLSGITPSPGGA